MNILEIIFGFIIGMIIGYIMFLIVIPVGLHLILIHSNYDIFYFWRHIYLMPIKCKDIKGLLVEKKDRVTILLDKEGKEFAYTRDHFKWGWNQAIDLQGQVSIGINPEKLFEVIGQVYWKGESSHRVLDPILLSGIIDAIIFKEQELLEVKNEH